MLGYTFVPFSSCRMGRSNFVTRYAVCDMEIYVQRNSFGSSEDLREDLSVWCRGRTSGIWADGRGGTTTRAHTGYGVRDQIIDVPRADENMDDEETSQTA